MAPPTTSPGRHRQVVVVGVPRSGSSWTANVLAATEAAELVREPDNEKLSAPAIWAKRGLGRFPVLSADDAASKYEGLWRWALSGAPDDSRLRLARRAMRGASGDDLENLVSGKTSRALSAAEKLAANPKATSAHSQAPASARSSLGGPRARIVAKSVHAFMATEWLAAKFDIELLVLLRHPANVLASWLDLDLPDADRHLDADERVLERFVKPWKLPPAGKTAVERMAWQIGLATCVLEDSASRHPEWQLRTHEFLCTDAESRFGALASALGLEWNDAAAKTIESSDQPGTGFEEQRQTSTVSDAWRRRLSPEQIDVLFTVLDGFPIRTWDIGPGAKLRDAMTARPDSGSIEGDTSWFSS